MPQLQFSKWFPPLMLLSVLLTFLPAVQAAGGGNSDITFAAIGDFGDGSFDEARVASKINGWGVDFVITLGDNRYDQGLYDPNSFDTVVGQFYCNYLTDVVSGFKCKKEDQSLSNAFFPALGNHDRSDGGGINEYLDYFTLPGTGVTTSGTSGSERYYDHVQGPIHFFVLDSDSALRLWWTGEMSDQKAWLEQQLATSTAAWKVVYLHHAPYSSANHGSEPLMQWPFADWGADAVIAAHDHTYERLAAGIPYFVNGLGGRSIYSFGAPLVNSQFRYNGDYGAMRVSTSTRLSPSTSTCTTKMAFEFVDASGGVHDPFYLEKEVPERLPPSGTMYARVASSTDDVEERVSNGELIMISGDLELGGDATLGLRFQCLNIPQGATIDKAYLEFTAVAEGTSTSTNVRIEAEKTDNAPAFSDTNNVTSRSLTSAATFWYEIPGWHTDGAPQQSPEIKAVIKEVVDLPDWSPGNSMVLVVSNNGTSGKRIAKAFDGVPSAAPRLYVKYSTSTTPTEPVVVHIGNLDAIKSGKKNWTAFVTATVHDSSENAVSGFTVTGTWSGGSSGSGSCVTDGKGQCTVSKGTRGSNLTFTVSSLFGVEEPNHDPDNDSNGTSITINKDSTGKPGGGGTVEAEKGKKKCNDGLDNDGDGLIDVGGIDTDGDGLIDVDADPDC